MWKELGKCIYELMKSAFKIFLLTMPSYLVFLRGCLLHLPLTNRVPI